jgi:polyphosphate kinase 2 (PPK2 family)
MINLKDLYELPTNYHEGDKIEDLQERLYLLFNETSKNNLPTIIVLEGWAGSGKGELLKAITKRLDPRKVKVYSLLQEEYGNNKYPFLQKYWKKLPPYGHLTLFDGSWYSGVSHRKKNKLINKKEYHTSFRSIIFRASFCLNQDQALTQYLK